MAIIVTATAASTTGSRGDAVILGAPSYAHLVYRPGVPLIAATILGGEVAFSDPELGL